jgi:DNA-directed RNA polymerase alpha subunit
VGCNNSTAPIIIIKGRRKKKKTFSMSEFIISCKESRIENNRSFYGCFYLGPFEPSQSITIANTLRRTLLSEIYGLSIVSVEIEGASHEYSSLPGVHESVLDILLNIKEIVLKKTIKNFTPQIGYLRARGPGVVTAAHLRLPPFIQSVDPDQYIATLSHNGFLNIKFIIQYGNKWLAAGRMPGEFGAQKNSSSGQSSNHSSSDMLSGAQIKMGELRQAPLNANKEIKDELSLKTALTKDIVNGTKRQINSRPLIQANNYYNFHYKKRRLFLKKLKHLCIGVSGSFIKAYLKMFSKNLNILFKYKKKRDLILKGKNKESLKSILKINNKYPGIHLKNGMYYINNTGGQHEGPVEKNNPNANVSKKTAERVKTNRQVSDADIAKTKKHLEFTKTRFGSTSYRSGINRAKHRDWPNGPFLSAHSLAARPRKKKVFFNVNSQGALSMKALSHRLTKHPENNSLNIDAIFNPITKVNYIIEVNDLKIAQNKLQTSFKISELYDTLSGLFIKELPNKAFGEPKKDSAFIKEVGSAYKKVGEYTRGEAVIVSNSTTQELTNLLELNQELSALTKETIKHNLILEIWTNGSIHPRDALNQALKNLINIFVQLKKIQGRSPLSGLSFSDINLSLLPHKKASFGEDASNLNNLLNNNNIGAHQQDFRVEPSLAELPNRSSVKNGGAPPIPNIGFYKILLKKIQMGELKSDEKLTPLNESTFLSTYISPKIRNYYFDKNNLLHILNISVKKNKQPHPPIFIAGRFKPENFLF